VEERSEGTGPWTLRRLIRRRLLRFVGWAREAIADIDANQHRHDDADHYQKYGKRKIHPRTIYQQ
jgi:hypothetical protein